MFRVTVSCQGACDPALYEMRNPILYHFIPEFFVILSLPVGIPFSFAHHHITCMSMPDRPWVVMKFGGTSVAEPENWKTIATLVRKNLDEGLRCLVVHSALAGVSNALEELPNHALSNTGEKAVDDIKDCHRAFARRADLDADRLLGTYFSRMGEIVAGISLIREASERLCAELMAMGELMASRLGIELLKQHGLNPEWLDARTALTTSDTTTHTQVWLDSTVEETSDTTLIDRIATGERRIRPLVGGAINAGFAGGYRSYTVVDHSSRSTPQKSSGGRRAIRLSSPFNQKPCCCRCGIIGD